MRCAIDTALTLAGGLGTRLAEAIGPVPKFLAPIAGRPFAAWLFDWLAGQGIRRVVLATGHGSRRIEEELGRRYAGLAVDYSREDTPLGTGGAIRLAMPRIDQEEILVLNGDSFCACDLGSLHQQHRERAAAGTMVLAWAESAGDYGKVTLNQASRVDGYQEKDPNAGPGWINAGMYLFRRDLLYDIPAGRPVSLEHELLPRWIPIGIDGFLCEGAFLDIGVPERWRASADFLARHWGTGAAK